MTEGSSAADVILADNQDITRVGMMYVCDKFCEQTYRQVADKTELIEQLKQNDEAVVVLDYTLFDINDIEELEILHERFPLAKWILFSFDLSSDFVRRAIAMSSLFSVLLKDSPLSEIRDCLRYTARGQRFICQRMAEILLAPAQDRMAEDVRLTRTEMEILKETLLQLSYCQYASEEYLQEVGIEHRPRGNEVCPQGGTCRFC